MAVKQLTKLNLQAIYKDFSNVVRERKKDFAGPFHKLYGTGFSGLGTLMKSSEAFSNILHGPNNLSSKELKLNFGDIA